jgi:hypothetical protein
LTILRCSRYFCTWKKIDKNMKEPGAFTEVLVSAVFSLNGTIAVQNRTAAEKVPPLP